MQKKKRMCQVDFEAILEQGPSKGDEGVSELVSKKKIHFYRRIKFIFETNFNRATYRGTFPALLEALLPFMFVAISRGA